MNNFTNLVQNPIKRKVHFSVQSLKTTIPTQKHQFWFIRIHRTLDLTFCSTIPHGSDKRADKRSTMSAAALVLIDCIRMCQPAEGYHTNSIYQDADRPVSIYTNLEVSSAPRIECATNLLILKHGSDLIASSST